MLDLKLTNLFSRKEDLHDSKSLVIAKRTSTMFIFVKAPSNKSIYNRLKNIAMLSLFKSVSLYSSYFWHFIKIYMGFGLISCNLSLKLYASLDDKKHSLSLPNYLEVPGIFIFLSSILLSLLYRIFTFVKLVKR